MVGLHEVVDREVVLAVVEPRATAMICLNSIIELMGRIRTMLRMLRASTPVESFCDVVRIVWDGLLVVLKLAQILLAHLAIVGGHALAVVGIGTRLHLINQIAHRERMILCSAKHQRLLVLVDLVHDELHPMGLTLLDLDDRIEVLLFIPLPATTSPSMSWSSGV